MKINMDEDLRAYQSRKAEERTDQSGVKWLFIIAFGVFIGTTASTLGVRAMDNAIVRYELNELNKQLAIEQARMKTRLAEQNKINAARLEKQKIEDQKRKAGYRQANETCIFRTEQARTNNSQQNRLYRDQACALVNQFR